MALLMIIVGAVLGGILLQSFPGGLIFGAILGGLGAWIIRLDQRSRELRDTMAAVDRRLKRLQKDVHGTDGEKPVPEAPEAKAPATRAIPEVAKTVSSMAPEAGPARHVVPPPTPVPSSSVVPPATTVPPSAVEKRPGKAESTPPAMTLPPRPARPIRPRPTGPTYFAQLADRWILGGNPLVKIGVVILFLGLAFALRYAAEHGLFPIWLRYAAVAATGVGLIAFGWRWRRREDNYGLILQGAGVGVLYLTTLAAMKLHPLIPLGPGFGLLFVIAAFAAFLAINEDAVVLAVVAALGAFAAPVLASTGEGNHILLFSYLTIVNLGILTIAWFRRWRVLNVIGYVCSFGLGSTWAAEYYRDELYLSTQPFLLLLFGIYVLITVLFARRTLAEEGDTEEKTFREHMREAPYPVKYVDGTLAFGVPFSVFWMQHLLVEPFPYGTAFSAMGFSAFYFLLAFVLIKGTGKRYLLLSETLIALGAVFGTLSIPLLETSWTATAWAVEAAGVFWIGYRQRQTHVRLFALLVLLGSAIHFVPELHWSRTGTVLDGPLLSAMLLTVATSFAYWLMRRAESSQLSAFELFLRPFVAGFGAAVLATIPLLLLAPEWAGPALAVTGTAFLYGYLRLSDREMLGAGWVYQLVGGAMFLSTLEAGRSGTVFEEGWLGLLGTCLVGAAMLAGSVMVSPARFGRGRQDEALPLATLGGAALLVGLAFINLAPLFVLSWRMSAMIWPIVGVATLVWAVRAKHKGAVLFALVLQVIAGFFHIRTSIVGDVAPSPAIDATAFLNSGFLGPVVIALAGLVCARVMHRASTEESIEDGLGWVAIAWGGLWWAFAWVMEVTRVAPASAVSASLIAVTLATAAAWSVAAWRLGWHQLGSAALAYVPVLVILGARDVLGDAGHPGVGPGALAWPAALIGHGLLLRRRPPPGEPNLLDYAHAVGAWLFIGLAAVEVHWRLLQWAEPSTAWPLVGGMLVPAAFLLAISLDATRRIWPVSGYFKTYAVTVTVPIVIYLLGWLWFTNGTSSGNAAPLPYLVVLNPLELGYLAVLAGVFLWWRMIRGHVEQADLDILAGPLLALTAFAAVTGGVIRACHHWAHVPWQLAPLLDSDTVQALLSIVWGTLAISLMLYGNRRRIRVVWLVGATLIGIVVVKLFLVELSAVGTLQRIVSFIVVGLLLLLVGYIAPLPPRDDAATPRSGKLA